VKNPKRKEKESTPRTKAEPKEANNTKKDTTVKGTNIVVIWC
jgi:hypothetical protein